MRSLYIHINPQTLSSLKSKGYNLCLSSNVKDNGQETTGNAVFTSIKSEKLCQLEKFVWDDHHEVIAKNSVKVSTHVFRSPMALDQDVQLCRLARSTLALMS